MRYTIITCSGISNTGKLTTQCGVALLQRSGGEIEACIPATTERELLDDALPDTEKILVLDGCSDCCALKKLHQCHKEPDIHIIATDCGIKKRGMDDPQYKEIEALTLTVQKAIREK